MKVVPVTIGPVRTSGVPSLLDSCADTIRRDISEPRIDAEFNSTVQVSSTSDPMIWAPSVTLLLNEIVDEVGTILIK